MKMLKSVDNLAKSSSTASLPRWLRLAVWKNPPTGQLILALYRGRHSNLTYIDVNLKMLNFGLDRFVSFDHRYDNEIKFCCTSKTVFGRNIERIEKIIRDIRVAYAAISVASARLSLIVTSKVYADETSQLRTP